MRQTSSRLAFIVFISINALLWSQSRYASAPPAHRQPLPLRVVQLYAASPSSVSGSDVDQLINTCAPLSVPQPNQCSHVQNYCEESDTFLSIQYLKTYFCLKPALQPALFFVLVAWLIFLFSTLGIGASDFFCPNLASISSFLGLDENVAGVTFLAFGNGSPDVFSTFSAMKADAGSLAIGELLGAASFIVTVVAGCMCLIKPFRVEKYPFLRDVGFFTVAVALLLTIAYDGTIHAWEAGILVTLYVVYVAVVILGTWWETRQSRIRAREILIRQEYVADENPRLYTDDPPYRDDDALVPNETPIPRFRSRALSASTPTLRLVTDDGASPLHRSEHDVSRHPHTKLPSFSLLGAIEFRQVINSLQQESSVNALSAFEAPSSPFAAGHYHRHLFRSPSRPRSPAPLVQHEEETDPWDEALGVPLNNRLSSRGDDNYPLQVPSFNGPGKTPSIILTTPADSIVALPNEDSFSDDVRPLTKIQRARRSLKSAFHILFPTLHEFGSKSFIGKIVAIFATPAVFALTLTLPVVVTTYGDPQLEEDKTGAFDDRLIDFEEEGVERALTAEVAGGNDHEVRFNKWLMTCQCALGPVFCAAVLFTRSDHFTPIVIITAICSVAVAVLVAIFADKGNDRAGMLIRAFMGFLVAIMWIMAIADEVVSVLQTFGFIFGLSQAIIGLTIFAIGNSMGDFVANISVAAFAPIMGFSACFGGPMLNILLGVGVSGSYVIQQTGHAFSLHFSTTLLVSTIGLLALLVATLAFVPYNDYWLSKRWGAFLIISYVVIMTINIIVEIKHA